LKPLLFCLPFSGASATVYGKWRRRLSDAIDIRPIELPGRGTRFGEPLQDELPPLASQLAREIHGALTAPYALFGHSLGALLAFEIAHALRHRRCPAPMALVVSGTAAPSRRDDSRFAKEMSDAELVEELRGFEGTPETALADAELMRLALPVLRADFRMCGRYRYRRRAPLDCPVHVLGGRGDTATSEQLLAWHEEGGPGGSLTLFDGGHFFIHEQEAAVLRLLRDRLQIEPPLRRVAGGLVKPCSATSAGRTA
jgi:surfactin synthase thioesterase subunit